MSLGLLKVSTLSFLVSISRREQVALVRGKPVYAVAEVALIPLTSHEDARLAITKARGAQKRHSAGGDDVIGVSSSDEDGGVESDGELLSEDNVSLHEDDPATQGQRPTSTVAEDVISRKGMYGRFADKFFARKDWSSTRPRNRRPSGDVDDHDLMEMKNIEEVSSAEPQDVAGSLEQDEVQGETIPTLPEDSVEREIQNDIPAASPAEVKQVLDDKADDKQIPLLSKLLTVSKLFFGSKNFYFSYDYDLSRSVLRQPEEQALPLTRTFDSTVSLDAPYYAW
jgi:hypothetical protein